MRVHVAFTPSEAERAPVAVVVVHVRHDPGLGKGDRVHGGGAVLVAVDPAHLAEPADVAHALDVEPVAAAQLQLEPAEARVDELVAARPVAEAHEHLVLGICTRGQELVTFGRFGGVDPDDPAETDALREVIATLDPFFEEAAGDSGLELDVRVTGPVDTVVPPEIAARCTSSFTWP